jgi:2'-hydroxyisoflavone reductase
MHILIIGGRQFLGRAIIEAALAKGHRITICNRGKTHPEYCPEHVEIIIGDRAQDLHLLDDVQFDCVIDTCGYIPSIVEISAKYFDGKVKSYCFVSTVSVYSDLSIANDEEGKRAMCSPEETQVTGDNYGAMKALCEDIIINTFQEHAFIVRPGLIVGPHDPADRFTYWPVRCGMRKSLGGIMLAPGNPNTAAWEFIDVRDLADFILLGLEQQLCGPYNVTGPRRFVEDILTESMACYDHTLEIRWISDEDLIAKGAIPWNDIPLWIPETIPGLKGMHNTKCEKAINAGLMIRSLAETIHDTLDWIYSQPERLPLKFGPSEEQEARLLGL